MRFTHSEESGFRKDVFGAVVGEQGQNLLAEFPPEFHFQA